MFINVYSQSKGRIVKNIIHQIQEGWLKWRADTKVLYDKKFPTKLKCKIYQVAIRLALL